MTRIDHRESDERALIALLPGLDDEARAALFRALSRSYPPNGEARSKAKAAVQMCKVKVYPAHGVTVSVTDGFWSWPALRWIATKIKGKAGGN
jgi:hypothetical protein